MLTVPCHPATTISVTARSLPSLSRNARDAILPSTRTASPLLQHLLHRFHRRPVDRYPVPFGGLCRLAVLALPFLRGRERERRRLAAVLQVADLRIAPGMAQQGYPVHVQHRSFLLFGFRCVPVLDRDLGDAELRPGLFDQRRRRRDSEPGRKTAALVEEEGPAVSAREVEGPPGEQHDLRGLSSVSVPRRFPHRGGRRRTAGRG